MTMTKYTSMQWLQINIANHYGLDKETYEKRLQWIETNEDKLEAFINEAEEPELMWKGVDAYRKAQTGQPVGIPVLLDACSSGFQVLSAISGCRKGCEATGLIDTGERPNAYMRIKERMEELMGGEIEVSYKDIKKASMTASYGSTKEPKRLFSGEALNAFYQACFDVMPNAFKLLKILKDTWQPYTEAHSWTMPDGHHVYIPVIQKAIAEVKIPELDNWIMNTLYTFVEGQKSGLANCANIVHSIDAYVLRSIIRYCSYDMEEVKAKKEAIEGELALRTDTSVQPEYVDITLADEDLRELSTEALMGLYIDLDDMLNHPSFPVMIIHDCFGVHPNHVNRLRYWYNQIMARLSSSDILDNICSQIYGEDVVVDIEREDLYEEIAYNNYAIC